MILSPTQRKCPNPTNNFKCHGILSYTTKYSCLDAERAGGLCRSCVHIKPDTGNKLKYQRQCSNPFNTDKCSGLMYYQHKNQFDRAERLNLLCWNCSKLSTRQLKKKHNIERLLSNEFESFYWIGFMLADGCFNSKGTFSLSLAIKDSDHFYKFCNYINYNLVTLVRETANGSYVIGKKFVAMSLQDYVNINLICKKFNINNKKTYNPPNIATFDSFAIDQMKALIAGFIDGDGHINKKGQIVIGCHYSWVSVLEHFASFISNRSYYIYKRSSMIYVRIIGHEFCRKLKSDLLELKIPLLSRKWDRIEEHKLSRVEIREKRYSEFVPLFESGMKQYKIAVEIGCNKDMIVKFVKQYRKENDIKK